MARKPPSLDHVKHVWNGKKWYSYFNTGQKRDGKAIYARLPDYSSASFWPSYAARKAHRDARTTAVAYTVADLLRAYQKGAKFAKLAANTQKLYVGAIGKIEKVWGEFPVNDLSPYYVRRAIDGEGWGGATQKIVTAVIGTAYTWGRRNELANVDPVKDIERPKGGEHQPWPDDLVEAALQCDDDTTRLAVHLLYFTGQRIGDVLKMRWGDVRPDHIYVEQEKTGKVVEPPIIAALQNELDRTPRRGIRILDGVNYNHLRRKLQMFTKAHGVHTVPHGLRKNAVNVLLEAGCTIAEVAAITGQTFQVVEHYAAKVNRRKLGNAAIVKLAAHRTKSA